MSVKVQPRPVHEEPKDATGAWFSGGGVSPFTTVPSHATYGSVTAANSRLREALSTSTPRALGVRPLNVTSRSSEGTTSSQFSPEPVVR